MAERWAENGKHGSRDALPGIVMYLATVTASHKTPLEFGPQRIAGRIHLKKTEWTDYLALWNILH
jgi:hypothetical protein